MTARNTKARQREFARLSSAPRYFLAHAEMTGNLARHGVARPTSEEFTAAKEVAYYRARVDGATNPVDRAIFEDNLDAAKDRLVAARVNVGESRRAVRHTRAYPRPATLYTEGAGQARGDDARLPAEPLMPWTGESVAELRRQIRREKVA